jgi:hypothetical protein
MAVINDPNTAANIQTVKAASTAAAAADMGAVVHIHPTSLLPGTSRPDNQYRVGMDPTSTLYDTFDAAIDTVDRWNSLGTLAPTQATGTLTVSAGTVASVWSALQSKTTFPLLGNMFSQLVSVIKTNATLTTGNYRFVGFGTLPGTPTAALPVTDGVGIEWIDSTGDMSFVVWSAGVKTLTLSLTASRPSDGLFHRPAIYFKTSRAYVELDNVSLGSIATPNPTTSALPLVILSVNGLSTLGAAATLQASFLGAGDSARNNQQISSGKFPWRKMGVGSEDSATSAAHVTVKPIPHNALGHYRVNHQCGLIATQAANSRLFEVRNSGTNLIVPTRLIVKIIQTLGFTTVTDDSLDIFRCTSFSAVDTVNTVTPTAAVKRTSGMVAAPGGAAIRGVTVAGAAAGMTGGTLTKNANASGQLPKFFSVTLPADPRFDLLDNFDDVNGTHPFVLANNEGFIIENRVLFPAAGTASVYIDFSWAEVSAY